MKTLKNLIKKRISLLEAILSKAVAIEVMINIQGNEKSCLTQTTNLHHYQLPESYVYLRVNNKKNRKEV